ncbi:hypothetical protein ACA910_002279 [Epithemia clementina (nom. ined.)]
MSEVHVRGIMGHHSDLEDEEQMQRVTILDPFMNSMLLSGGLAIEQAPLSGEEPEEQSLTLQEARTLEDGIKSLELPINTVLEKYNGALVANANVDNNNEDQGIATTMPSKGSTTAKSTVKVVLEDSLIGTMDHHKFEETSNFQGKYHDLLSPDAFT